MGLIQCSEECHFQTDGYCNLNKFTQVNSIYNDCPHFIPRLLNDRYCLPETYHTDKL